MNVSLQIPAYLSNFSTEDSGRTIGSLKVFYVGKTEDGRVFSTEFAEKLAASLPNTPVVAFYSELKGDFIGHNKTQYVYGVVPTDPEAHFEEEDGVTWLICKVILFTDRVDNVGEIASKIIGHKHSLELNPKTTKYDVVTNEFGKTEIVFTEGSLVGLSVLGDSQSPAFTGSEFFSTVPEEELKERFENFFSYLREDRGIKMEKTKFEKLVEFRKLSYKDKEKRVCEEFQNQLGHDLFYLLDINDTQVVFDYFDFDSECSKTKRCDYSIDEQNVVLSNMVDVIAKYYTEEELNKIEECLNNYSIVKNEEETVEEEEEEICPNCGNKKSECNCPLENEIEIEIENDDNVEEEKCASCGKKKSECDCPSEDEKEEEICPDCKKKKSECICPSKEEELQDKSCDEEEPCKKENEEVDNEKEKESTCNSTLTDSERQELEAYRRNEKERLISSYENDLSEELLNNYKSNIENYNLESLEIALALEYRKFAKANTKNNNQVPFGFNMKPTYISNEPKGFVELIKARLNK